MAKKYDIQAAIKLQFRQLDSFIHEDFKNSNLKFVKRFNETRLSKEQFREIVKYVELSGLVSMATPFDNDSIPWIKEMDVSVIKVASCSIDDWPLLEELSKINKKFIISTAGASMKVLKKVYNIFKHNSRDFTFLHCIGEYPTPCSNSNLKRITILKSEFPDIEIGLSTHESPLEESIVPLAVALGCTVIEKHVGVETPEISLNAYSNTPEQMEKVIKQVEWTKAAVEGESSKEKDTLVTLKRGIYAKTNISKGQSLTREDFYYAMPVQEGQLNASNVEEVIGLESPYDILGNAPILKKITKNSEKNKKIREIVSWSLDHLEDKNIAISGVEKAEISCHYGLDNFSDSGAFIVDKVNREYCKKLIIMSPGQNHPTHHHIQKEEAFELLSGDCTLVLSGRKITMKRGKPVVIARGVKHSFSSQSGCVIEEISTTHVPGDSVYEDPRINSLKLADRKIKVKLTKEEEH